MKKISKMITISLTLMLLILTLSSCNFLYSRDENGLADFTLITFSSKYNPDNFTQKLPTQQKNLLSKSGFNTYTHNQLKLNDKNTTHFLYTSLNLSSSVLDDDNDDNDDENKIQEFDIQKVTINDKEFDVYTKYVALYDIDSVKKMTYAIEYNSEFITPHSTVIKILSYGEFDNMVSDMEEVVIYDSDDVDTINQMFETIMENYTENYSDSISDYLENIRETRKNNQIKEQEQDKINEEKELILKEELQERARIHDTKRGFTVKYDSDITMFTIDGNTENDARLQYNGNIIEFSITDTLDEFDIVEKFATSKDYVREYDRLKEYYDSINPVIEKTVLGIGDKIVTKQTQTITADVMYEFFHRYYEYDWKKERNPVSMEIYSYEYEGEFYNIVTNSDQYGRYYEGLDEIIIFMFEELEIKTENS